MNGSTTPSGGNATTVYAALQVSGTSWILAVGDPADASRTGLHRLAPHDVDGLLGKLGQARDRAAAVSGGDVRVMLVYEAGYEGFRVARRPGGEDLEVVVCDPASLEVVRRKRRAKTDRIDSRRMVRALRAWDGGSEHGPPRRLEAPGMRQRQSPGGAGRARRVIRGRNAREPKVDHTGTAPPSVGAVDLRRESMFVR